MGGVANRSQDAVSSERPERKGAARKLRAVLLLGLLVGAAGVLLAHWPVAESLELSGLDLLFHLRGTRPPPSGISVVALDEDSLLLKECMEGQDPVREKCVRRDVPWPRTVHADLVRLLAREGARVVAFDVLFDTAQAEEADRDFAAALEEAGNVVLGSSVDVTVDPRFRMSQTKEPIPLLVKAAAAVGDVGFPTERDGVMRRTWLMRGDRPSLALAAYEAATKERPERRTGQRWIDYYGPGRTVPTVSYYQALEPEQYLPPGYFKDKVVFVGLSQPAAAGPAPKDAFATPFGSPDNPLTYGVEIHATVAGNLLEGRRIDLLPPVVEALVLLLLPLAAVASFLALRPVLGVGALFGLELLVWAGAYVAFTKASLWTPLIIPAVVQLPAAYVASLIWYYLTTVRERERIRRAFNFYLSPEMIAKIVADPSSLNLGGEEIVATALFTDVKGFTTIAESMPAPETAGLLNAYFSRITTYIFDQGGTLIKFIGDAVFAIWGAPLRMEDHAARACEAALAIAEGQAREQFITRIGVHTGPMLIGNLGSEQRFDYTAIGDAVNFAARLEGLNKHFGTRALTSRATLSMTGDAFLVRPLGSVRVVGKLEPIEIFELVGRRGGTPSLDPRVLERFGQALEAFRSRDFEKAAEGFREAALLCGEGGDGASELYLRESLRWRAEPPPEDWDGSITFETK